MKRIIFPFLLLLSVITVHAQKNSGFVTGKIYTAEGLPAADIRVFIQGLNKTATSQANGYFRIDAPTGKQNLIVQPQGKTQFVIPVEIQANTETKLPQINLKERATDLKEVVVTGQYTAQSMRNSVYNIRTITSDMVRLRGATDLKTILSTELGLRFSNDPATGISDPQIMGMSGASIKILLDGVPMMDRGTSKESLGQIDINSVERIEIIEGPMSVVYGSDAMAGVINIITKRGAKDNLSVTARVQEETAGKEYNAFKDHGVHNEYLNVNWQKNGFQLGASGTRNNFGGWQGNLPGRKKEWMPKEQWLTSAVAGYKNQNLDLWYRFNGTDETLNSMGDINSSGNVPVAADQKYLSKRWFHQLQGALVLNEKLSLNAAASYTDYSRRTLSTNVDINTGNETLATDPGTQDKDVFKSTFFRSTLQYKLTPEVFLQPGIEFNRNTGTGARIIGTPVINDYAFFLSSQIQLTEAIQINPGFRMMKNSTYDAPPIVPSFHAKIRLDQDIDLRFSYSRGFRAPILRELYFTFKDASHDIVGNPNLKAEHSNSFEGSVVWALKNTPELRINSNLRGFYNDFRNRIDLGLDAQNGNVNTYLNISRFKTTGGEWINTFNWKDVQATVGLAYIGRYNQLSELKDALGSTPEFTWSPEVTSTISYLLPKISTNISLFYKFTGKKPDYITSTENGTPIAKLTEVSSFHIADLTLNKTINKYLTLNGGARNLFDVTRIRNTAGGDSAHSGGSSMPVNYGRSFFLGLTMQWSKNN